MSLGTQIVAGSAVAYKLAKSLLGSPRLTNTDPTRGPLYSVSLDVETHQQNGGAEVSESLVILQDSKRLISDNVAPGSWTWDISGYIPGSLAEVTNYFTPVVTKNTGILRTWFKNGTILEYRDIDMSIYKRVVIKSLSINVQADCRNKQPFSMSLKEINVMDDFSIGTNPVTTAASPSVGSVLGLPISAGTVIAEETVTTVAVAAAVGTWALSAAATSSGSGEKVQKSREVITFPDSDVVENFTFQANVKAGILSFKFKWQNDRWNCWVTLPDGEIRTAGVYPNVENWSGSSDYSLTFETSLSDTIGKDDLQNTQMVFVTWQ